MNQKNLQIDDIKLKGQADMKVDDTIILFRPTQTVPESPHANDLLYLNACLWIYGKTDGMIIYITGDNGRVYFFIDS